MNTPIPGLTVLITQETEPKYLNTLRQPIQVIDQLRAVSNYEYETKLNEEKRKILLLKPEYLGVFIGDMRNIMKYPKSSDYIDSNTKKTYNSQLNGV